MINKNFDGQILQGHGFGHAIGLVPEETLQSEQEEEKTGLTTVAGKY